ncbi:hypothetical protein [Streptomyces sp. NPDC003719]
MTNGEVHGPAVCPGCRTQDTALVAEARTGKRGRRDDLGSRLAPAPEHTGNGCMHFAGKWGLPWLTVVGGVAAVLIFVATVAVVRTEHGDAQRVRAGESRAAALTAEARYCYTCQGVFQPSGTPWQGVLTPERFRHHVWTQAGYGDQLDGKAKAAELP